MLRSLDPATNFEQPKSKKFRPTKDETKKFSSNELAYVEDGERRDEDLKISRHIRDSERKAALAAVKEKEGR